MKYVKIYGTLLDASPYSEAEPAELGTWLLLMSFCATQENGGMIANGAMLSNKALLKSVGISTDDLQNSPNGLWSIEEDTIIVHGYSGEDESKYRARRDQASKGGKAKAANAKANATANDLPIKPNPTPSDKIEPNPTQPDDIPSGGGDAAGDGPGEDGSLFGIGVVGEMVRVSLRDRYTEDEIALAVNAGKSTGGLDRDGKPIKNWAKWCQAYIEGIRRKRNGGGGHNTSSTGGWKY